MANIIGDVPDLSLPTENRDEYNNEVEKIAPQGDYVLLEVLRQERTKGGLVIPKTASNQRDAIYCKVWAIGQGRLTEYGVVIECTVKPGQYVLIPRGAGTKIDHEKCELRLLRDCEILCSIEESRIITMGLVR